MANGYVTSIGFVPNNLLRGRPFPTTSFPVPLNETLYTAPSDLKSRIKDGREEARVLWLIDQASSNEGQNALQESLLP